MVGRVLESEKARGCSIDEKLYEQRLHGRPGHDSSLLCPVLGGLAELRCLGGRPLCAQRYHSRASLGIDDSVATTYYTAEQIRPCLNDFEEKGLVCQPSNDVYEWVHDYLATAFRDFAATVMNPTNRDNILFLVERRLRTRQLLRRPSERRGRCQETCHPHRFCNRCSPHRLPHDHRCAGRPSGSVPAFVGDRRNGQDLRSVRSCGSTWAVFTYKFSCLFIRLRTGAYFFPWLLSATGIAAVSVGVVSPRFWLISLGMTALLFSVKFFHIAFHWPVPQQARTMIVQYGVSCVIATIVSGCGSWLFFYFWTFAAVERWEPFQREVLAWSLSTIVSLAAILAIGRHATDEGVARWLGILDRSYEAKAKNNE